jgi:hypothetical protein
VLQFMFSHLCMDLLKFFSFSDHYVLPTIAEEPISNASDPIISFQSFIDLEKAQPQAPSDDDDDDLDDLGLASDDDNGSIQSGSETDGDSVLEPISRQSDSAPRRSKSGGKRPTAHHSRSDSQAPQDPTDDPRTCSTYFISCPFSFSIAANFF